MISNQAIAEKKGNLFYLDTNVLEGYFKRIYLSRRKNTIFELPSLWKFFLYHKEIKLVVSSWTLAEVMEHMWKSYGFESDEVAREIQKFIQEFDIFLIESFEVKPRILRWIRKFKIDIKDSIHLTIAIDEGIPILTDDRSFSERGSIVHGFVTIAEFFLEFFPSNDLIK